MNEIHRNYRESDYPQCEALVNQAWGFDDIFAPQALSDLVKYLYTKGSVLGSNYRTVVEVDGKVAGFIFGLNEFGKKPGNSFLFGLSILWRLMLISSEKPENKQELLSAMKSHEANRTSIVKRGKSEIVLFVVSKEHQGKGFGKQLWSGFKEKCKESGVPSIIVETNKLGASGFYELLGFRHLGNFSSPLHEFATKGGQACMYEYMFEMQKLKAGKSKAKAGQKLGHPRFKFHYGS
jgi:ribosomal protein S18 acetylase RimI-like enzyme